MSTDNRKGYRGGWFDNIDVPVVASTLICALLFVLVLVAVKSVDYSPLNKAGLEELSTRVAKILMPLKPPGKSAPKADAKPAGGPRTKAPAGAAGAEAQGAAARIERSRKTVGEQIMKVQERITKAAVLSILSGKGPGALGTPKGRPAGSGGLSDWGDLDAKLGKLEGLTKFDGRKGAFNQDGAAPAATKGEEVAATSGIDKMVKGFQNAKVSALSKIGSMELEKPELVETSKKYTGNRNLQEIAAFISKKQAAVSMMYEERLKINPSLEGKVTVALIIEEDGTISSASVVKSETTLDDPDFHSELLRRIRRWVFPPSTGGPVEMKSPFIFKPA